jgi:hypothetical protein
MGTPGTAGSGGDAGLVHFEDVEGNTYDVPPDYVSRFKEIIKGQGVQLVDEPEAPSSSAAPSSSDPYGGLLGPEDIQAAHDLRTEWDGLKSGENTDSDMAGGDDMDAGVPFDEDAGTSPSAPSDAGAGASSPSDAVKESLALIADLDHGDRTVGRGIHSPLKPKPGAWESFGRGAADTAGFGFSDEAAGVGAAAGELQARMVPRASRRGYDAPLAPLERPIRQLLMSAANQERDRYLEADRAASSSLPYLAGQLLGSVPATMAAAEGQAARGAGAGVDLVSRMAGAARQAFTPRNIDQAVAAGLGHSEGKTLLDRAGSAVVNTGGELAGNVVSAPLAHALLALPRAATRWAGERVASGQLRNRTANQVTRALENQRLGETDWIRDEKGKYFRKPESQVPIEERELLEKAPRVAAEEDLRKNIRAFGPEPSWDWAEGGPTPAPTPHGPDLPTESPPRWDFTSEDISPAPAPHGPDMPPPSPPARFGPELQGHPNFSRNPSFAVRPGGHQPPLETGPYPETHPHPRQGPGLPPTPSDLPPYPGEGEWAPAPAMPPPPLPVRPPPQTLGPPRTTGVDAEGLNDMIRYSSDQAKDYKIQQKSGESAEWGSVADALRKLRDTYYPGLRDIDLEGHRRLDVLEANQTQFGIPSRASPILTTPGSEHAQRAYERLGSARDNRMTQDAIERARQWNPDVVPPEYQARGARAVPELAAEIHESRSGPLVHVPGFGVIAGGLNYTPSPAAIARLERLGGPSTEAALRGPVREGLQFIYKLLGFEEPTEPQP